MPLTFRLEQTTFIEQAYSNYTSFQTKKKKITGKEAPPSMQHFIFIGLLKANAQNLNFRDFPVCFSKQAALTRTQRRDLFSLHVYVWGAHSG